MYFLLKKQYRKLMTDSRLYRETRKISFETCVSFFSAICDLLNWNCNYCYYFASVLFYASRVSQERFLTFRLFGKSLKCRKMQLLQFDGLLNIEMLSVWLSFVMETFLTGLSMGFVNIRFKRRSWKFEIRCDGTGAWLKIH